MDQQKRLADASKAGAHDEGPLRKVLAIEQEARKIIADAEAEANRIVANAQSSAEELIRQAKQTADGDTKQAVEAAISALQAETRDIEERAASQSDAWASLATERLATTIAELTELITLANNTSATSERV